MSNLLDETNFIMKKYKIKANKSLGQNFLINEKVIENITQSADINNEDVVIEIGSGLGTLTQRLLENAGKVIAIELDRKMIQILQERFYLYKNFEILNQDVLKVDLKSIIKREKEKFKTVKIVANLPYYITTPIVMKLLEEELDIESITIMIQKEVAERLVAIPGEKNTGAITYTVYYYSTTEKIMEVLKDSFIPEPEVTSEVINIKIRKEIPVEVKNKEVMFRIIKCAFMQRRKTLLNALCNTKIFLSKEEGVKILNKINISENARAEELTLQDFANITNEILATVK